MRHLIRQTRRIGLVGVLAVILAFLAPNLARPALAEGMAPRVLLSAFSTIPETPAAGEEFTIKFTLKNASSTTGVQNLKTTISAPDNSLLPVGGTASVYTRWIGAGAAVGYELRFRPLPTADEGPHQLALHVDYEEAAGGTALASDETMTVNVRQHARVETSELELQPSNLTAGQDTSLTFSVLNKGKNKLYNTSVAVKPDQAVTAPEQFIGTIEAGAAGAVDMVLHAEAASNAPVTLVISYEDAGGAVTSFERQVELNIDAPSASPQPTPENQAESVGMAITPLTLGLPLLLVAALVVIIVIVRRRRKRAAAAQESLAALDAEPPLMPEDQE
ncbi:COG1361 family protein [Propionibacterium australiense]|nr:hypothetical protein [Propionibacterium australiense]RLP09512.1 hypothetical protein D9T14_07070 [Propionibacterium australiense]